MVELWGVLNVTPDSFSDGGRFIDTASAVREGRKMRAQGAWAVDVGGESTRPGAAAVSEDEELARVLPAIGALARAGVRVSVDTMKSAVASAALANGASIVNDVSGGLFDSRILRVVASFGCQYVISHWRGPSANMMERAHYDEVAAEVAAELQRAVERAVGAGVDPSQIVLDPGIGFAKTTSQNWEVLGQLEVVLELGFPVMVGTSRKRFLGSSQLRV